MENHKKITILLEVARKARKAPSITTAQYGDGDNAIMTRTEAMV